MRDISPLTHRQTVELGIRKVGRLLLKVFGTVLLLLVTNFFYSCLYFLGWVEGLAEPSTAFITMTVFSPVILFYWYCCKKVFAHPLVGVVLMGLVYSVIGWQALWLLLLVPFFGLVLHAHRQPLTPIYTPCHQPEFDAGEDLDFQMRQNDAVNGAGFHSIGAGYGSVPRYFDCHKNEF